MKRVFPNDTSPKTPARLMLLEAVGNRSRTAPKSAAGTKIVVETFVEPGGVASSQSGEFPTAPKGISKVTDAVMLSSSPSHEESAK